MEIKFLGTGGAFDYEKGTSAAVVEHGGTKILIDCGYSTFSDLCRNNLISEIDHVLITHLHGDHIGSLPTFVAYYEMTTKKKAQLIVPTTAFKQELKALLQLTFELDRVEFNPIEDFEHIGFIDTRNQHVEGMQTYAYYFKDGDELIYYSGDLGVLDTTVSFLESRTENNVRVFQDINKKIGGKAHVSYQEAQERLAEYDVYGYHCDKRTVPEDCTIKLAEDFPELNYPRN